MLTLTPPVAVGTSTVQPRTVEVRGVTQRRGDQQTLSGVSFEVGAGEIVAIAGGSGAGKTSLLEAIVGLQPITDGSVRLAGTSPGQAGPDHQIGFVPQDDIIHLELPLRRSLETTAALRLPAGTPDAELAAIVDRTLERLDLAHRADVVVSSLSGGQRKRASIAAELLTNPSLFFLDEPTSGLDPSTSAEVMTQLRRLADDGTTVVVTTHAPGDLHRCDRVVFLARDGHVAFVGPADEACAYFGARDLTEVYEYLAAGDPVGLARRFEAHRVADELAAPHRTDRGEVFREDPVATTARPPATRTKSRRQWWALTRRNAAILLNNRLTLAILVASPAMVVGMMAVLFRPGTFSADATSPMAAIQTLFWVAFASFFFGLTYGLLQIVGEFEIFRRERLSGLRVSAYVAAKLTVLAPILFAVNVVMLVVLRSLDRLPSLDASRWAELLLTLVLISLAAMTMGLFASAAVRNASQATLALPMLCFPQVLFAGAVVPVAEMAGAGRWMSTVLADRWGFEAMARIFEMDQAISGDPGTSGYLDAFEGSPTTGWIALSIIIVVATLATVITLDRRTRVARS